MFRSLLIANRGEIAVRIMRTAKRMGLRCIAVYSEADRESLHVATADEAHPIGPAPAAESYLRIDCVLDAARRAGAEAIHPGYGFLAENSGFAEACASAGIIFVGPTAEAIRLMGDKARAKALMRKAGVPVVPGYDGEDQSQPKLAEEAKRIGFPVLIKAAAGGGGRGMHIVERAEDLAEALAAARRIARSAFGSDRVLLERYLARPRHIEVQVLADSHGTIIDLGTRDCSVQRRYQKIIEEAPAPALPETLQRAIAEAALVAARAVAYRNAGTVEFIAEGEAFFFMEMNTRLQVEHPATEMISGLDLVEWQLRIAAGEALPFAACPRLSGHAIEARLCAEDPAADWRPATGRIVRLAFPEHEGVRIDSGVREGDTVTPFYDSLLAKIIAHGPDRATALRRLVGALEATVVDGVATNLALLRRILAHDAFRRADLSTHVLAEHAEDLLAPPRPAPDRVLIAAAAALLLDETDRAERAARASADPHSPWVALRGWRLHGTAVSETRFDQDGHLRAVRAEWHDGFWRLHVCDGSGADSTVVLRARRGAEHDLLRLEIAGVVARARVRRYGDEIVVTLADGTTGTVKLRHPLGGTGGAAAAAGSVTAPIPGRVVRVLVSPGQAVARGETLLVLEAMKTELRLVAPCDGVVQRLDAAVGDLVTEGTELAFVSADSAA